MRTHEVANQPPPLEGYNLFTSDRVLIEAVRREAAWADERVRRLGEIAGGEPLAWGRLANTNPPVLRTHDRYGNRIDEVEFHPAWHELMRLAVAPPAPPRGAPAPGPPPPPAPPPDQRGPAPSLPAAPPPASKRDARPTEGRRAQRGHGSSAPRGGDGEGSGVLAAGDDGRAVP